MSYIKPYIEEAEFLTQEKCSINELLNDVSDKSCSVARASVAPGICTQLHALKNTIERYIILEGEAEVEINHTKPVKVSYLDSITIPEGAAQRIRNIGEGELIFLCICTPRFEQINYQNLDVSLRQEYQSIECQLHSELELAIMHGQEMLVCYFDNLHKKEEKQRLKPYDIVTRMLKNVNSEELAGEFLLAYQVECSNIKIEIRLDHIRNYSLL
jgi:mannose-6-phosphate isomerase-like protein (cupin superfamily)/transcriptional antiterminator Rof (Rho-off)